MKENPPSGSSFRPWHPLALRLLGAGALAFFLQVSPSEATPPNATTDCSSSFQKLGRQIETLDDLLLAFTRGLVPDLSVPQQRNAFELYRKMRFGNPGTSLKSDTVEQITEEIKNHPELEKQPFRNFQLKSLERSYPVTPALSEFLDSQVKSAGQVRGNLFQVDANQGYWKKLFQYEQPEEFRVAPADKAARKALQKQAEAHFEQFLDERLPKTIREFLANYQGPPKDRAGNLYEILVRGRLGLQAQGKDTRLVSQAIVDLVHGIGYQDLGVAKSLKSLDGLERLTAYRKVLEQRDSFAMELGFPDHFEGVLKAFNISLPTGIASAQAHAMPQKLQTLEAEMVAKAQVLGTANSTKTIRHLSLIESPYRSCLGGSDCSSRTYLTRALDPNYHYFTLTNDQGFSSGHITIVLGEANLKGEKVKVAFVDKVQNVDHLELPVMLEGVRRSVEEKGYKLVLPENLGGHNGISNDDETTYFIQKSIQTDRDSLMTGFRPNVHTYSFKNAYSRAEEGLPVRTIVPLRLPQGTELQPGAVLRPWRTSQFQLEKLIQASIQLKHGDLDDKIRYISSMKTIAKSGLHGDPEFEKTLERWLADSNQPFELRRQILLDEWTEYQKPLSVLLDHFTVPTDQVNLIQNFLDTPRYRQMMLSDRERLPSLMVRVRDNKKVRDQLISEYGGGNSELIRKILDAKDLAPPLALKALWQIETSLNSNDVHEVVSLLKLIRGTSLEAGLQDSLVKNYLKAVHGDAALGRGLATVFDSSDPVLQQFGSAILKHSLATEGPAFPILHAYKEIQAIQETQGSASLERAAESWLGKVQVESTRKADFVMSQMGTGKSRFVRFLEAIPESQRRAVSERIEKTTSLGVFQRLAKAWDLERLLFDHGGLESFQFHPIISKEQAANGGVRFTMGEGKEAHQVTLTRPFEMQVTPFTQLETLLATGNNYSEFIEHDLEVTLGGEKIRLDPNRPVDSYSWHDEQEVIDALNGNDPHWKYRRPTSAEWEYAARGGKATKYSHGDTEENSHLHAWTKENSGDKTHRVAELRPNPFGLFDMHGNVWEWVEDLYGRYPEGLGVTNPSGPATSRNSDRRVARAGGWHVDAPNSRSASRVAIEPDDRSNSIGFRLVRTPK